MDNLFQLRQDMTNEELQRFGQDRMQQEKTVEDYITQREARDHMNLAQLKAKSQTAPVAEKPIVADMPAQPADEKDWKRKKRHKEQLLPQAMKMQSTEEQAQQNFAARVAFIQERQVLDKQAKDIFQDTLRADMLTPKYVLEHFTEVRTQLDKWKRHLELFGEGGAANGLMVEDQKLRLVHMEEMYRQGEEAFRTALGALGFRYQPQEEGSKKFEKLSEKQQKQALQENRSLCTAIAKGAADMDNAVADELIAQEKQRRRPEVEAFQESTRQDPKYAFIESQNLSHDYQYVEIENVKRLLEEHPAEYAQNKDLLDRLYQEFFHLMEYNGVCYEISRTIGDIQFDNRVASTSGMQKRLNIRLEEQERKMRLIRNRATAIKDGIRHIMFGTTLSEPEYFILKDFMPVQYEFGEEIRAAKKQAVDYLDREKEKKETFERIAEQLYGERAQELIQNDAAKYMMFMEAGKQEHNEAVVRALLTLHVNETMQTAGGKTAELSGKETGRMMKTLVLPYLERLMNYDTKDLAHCTEEELMAKGAELQELSFISMQVANAAKYHDPDDKEGRSIKEVYCDKKDALFTMKCAVIQSYAMKARGLSMAKAYRCGGLDETCFTAAELENLRGRHSLQPEDALSMDQMLVGARELVERAEVLQSAAYRTYFQTPSIKQSYIGLHKREVQTTHPEYHRKLETAKQDALSVLEEPTNALSYDQWEKYYTECGKMIVELEKELEEQEEPGMRTLEIQDELERRRQYLEAAQIEYSLSGIGYTRTGDQKSLLGEPIFRSYSSVESLPAFQNMSDEEFALMCKRLSAGTFQEDKKDPDRFEAYYAENMEGLRMYKQRMAEHYEMLERTFHHKVPSVEYIMEHRQQMEQWFANIQVDAHMVTGMRDLIDLTDPTDLRLYHLVLAYNSIGGYVASIGIIMALEEYDYADAEVAVSGPIKAEARSMEYLDQAPIQRDQEALEAELAQLEQQKDTYEDKKQWLARKEAAQSPLMAERFRQVAADALHIATADRQTQIAYLGRMQELADYIEQYKEVPSLNIEQFKGWLTVAQNRLPFLVKSLYESEQQESDKMSVLDSGSILGTELESGDAERMLDAATEVCKMNVFFMTADLDRSVMRKHEDCPAWKECQDVEWNRGITKLEKMSPEFKKEFIQEFYRRKEILLNRMSNAIERIKGQLPEQLEDRDQYATYLATQTELGKEYDALCIVAHHYFKDDSVLKLAVEFRKEHVELLDRTGKMDQDIVDACVKYDRTFQKIGYTKAIGEMQLHTFQEQFIERERDKEKEKEAKTANSQAGKDSYDILHARLTARQQAGHATFQELAHMLGGIHRLAEDILTPDYMVYHAEELFAFFEAMDAYNAQLRENPGLENHIPARDKILWARNKFVFEKYRSYVMQFARSRCVDAERGEYLPEETTQAEKEEVARNLSEQKEDLAKYLGGFGNYSQKVSVIAKRVGGIRKLKKVQKAAVLKSLQECGEWLKDLTRYLAKPLELTSEDLFDTQVMTLMSMLGYIEKDLREAEEVLTKANRIGDVSELLSGMKEISATFTEFKERIPRLAQDRRTEILESGEQIELTFRDLVMEAQQVKTFHIEGRQQDVGAGASDVIPLTEGDQRLYFKEDEMLKSLKTVIDEALPMLENEQLREQIGNLIEYMYKNLARNETRLNYFMDVINFVKEDGSLNQTNFSEFCSHFKVDVRQMVLSNLENWKAFAKRISRGNVTIGRAEGKDLLLDLGANMTARNFASERVAELLGQKDLIVRNREAVVEENGVQKKGFVMDQAQGIPASQVADMAVQQGYDIHFTEDAQKKLLNLQIIDNIIGQVDRHGGNFFVQCEIDTQTHSLSVTGVTGIDNDFAFGRSEQIGGQNTPSVLSEDGEYLYSMIDRQMYESLMSVSPELLATNLEGVIEPQYLDALKKRYEKIRQAIREAKSKHADFFNETTGWGDQTAAILTADAAPSCYVKKVAKV